MSDLTQALRFHGRFGNETEERARMRRYRERCEAANRIEALEAELAECRAAQPAPIRDWSEDFAHENGNYENLCSACRCVFYGHKRRSTCKACAAQPAPIPAQTGTESGGREGGLLAVTKTAETRMDAGSKGGLLVGGAALTEEAKDVAGAWTFRERETLRDMIATLRARLAELECAHNGATYHQNRIAYVRLKIATLEKALGSAHIKAGQAGKKGS